MANKMIKLILKVTPLLLFILVCIKVFGPSNDGSTASLLYTLNALHESQRQAYYAAQSRNVSYVELSREDFKRKKKTPLTPVHFNQNSSSSEFRSWFDSRPDPEMSLIKSHKDHTFFNGFHIENADVCKDEMVDLLIYVQSSPGNREQRHAIRQTWAGSTTYSDVNIKHVFFMGRTNQDSLQMRIFSESATYKDIVQGDFLSSFGNLTRTAMTVLTWITRHCSHARYILKADDDIFVDTFRVVSQFIPDIASKKLALACHTRSESEIVRNPKSRWYTPPEVLQNQTHFPPFCPGFFALMTGNLVPHLYANAFSLTAKTYFVADDVYVFGLLTKNVTGLERVNIDRAITVQHIPDPTGDLLSQNFYKFLAFGVGSPNDHQKLWSTRRLRLMPWEAKHSNYEKDVLRNRTGKLVL